MQQPTAGAAGATVNPAVQVATEDALGNPVSTAPSIVTLTLNAAASFADGTTSTTAITVNGVATFGNLIIIDAAGSYTLTASGSYANGTSNSFTVSATSATMIAFAQQPSDAPSGVSVVPPVRVAVQDGFLNTVTTDSSTVTLTLNGGVFANGSTTVSAPAVNGVATFNNLAINVSGTYTLTASDGQFPSITSNSFTIAIASKLAFVQSPTSAVAGDTINPAVQVAIEDINGSVVLTDASSVTLTLVGSVFAGGSATATAAAVNGVATFNNLVIDGAASFKITAADGLLSSATSGSFTISPAAASTIFLSREPGSAVAGVALRPLVIALDDAYGNVAKDSSTVTVTLNGGTFANGSATASAGAVGGVANFGNLVIDSPGSYTLTFSDGALPAVSSNTFIVALLDSIASFYPYPGGAYPGIGNLLVDSGGNLFGTAETGGPGGSGTVFELAHGSSTTTLLASFNGVNGSQPFGGLTFDSSGDIFGTTDSGGFGAGGTVFEIPVGTTSILTLASFNYANGAYPDSTLTFDTSGNLFGTTSSGGANNDGVVFEIDHGSGALIPIAAFNGTNGQQPSYAGVTFDTSGNLFGTTLQGGTSGYGTVFEIAAGSSSIVTLVNFNRSNGGNPDASLVLDSSGNLFGTASTGGSNNMGTVFEILKGSSSITTVAGFNNATGYFPLASVTLDSSGNLFGTTQNGGTGNYGTVFEIPRGTTTIATIANFVSGEPEAGVSLDSNGNLFGTTINGNGNFGTLFEIVHGSSLITTLTTFLAAGGEDPTGLTLDSAGNAFGTASGAGTYGDGTVFEILRGTTALTTLVNFNGADGQYPNAAMTLDSSGNLFGTTEFGGASDSGTVFEIAHGSTTITTLVNFNNSTGEGPYSGLTLDSSGNLLGTTLDAGINNEGTVFEIAHGTSSLSVVANFSGSTGYNVQAGVVLDSNGNLFGAASNGGTGAVGVIFEILHGSSQITDLASFNKTNGEFPIAGLMLDSTGNLFGTAQVGGANNDGTVFEIPQGTTSLITLVNFNDANGQNPDSALTLDSSGDLFGTTAGGGANFDGTVFEIPNGTTNVTTLLSFNGSNGISPVGNLFLDSSGNLLGTTKLGGSHNAGSVFELSLNPPILSFAAPPVSTTAGSAINSAAGVQVNVSYPWGNIDTADNSDVTLTLSGGTFSGGSATASATVINGVANFSNLVIDTAGNYTLTAADGTSTSSISQGFTIAAASASALAFIQAPGNTPPGNAISPAVTVAIEDLFGNPVSTESSTITLTLSGGSLPMEPRPSSLRPSMAWQLSATWCSIPRESTVSSPLMAP